MVQDPPPAPASTRHSALCDHVRTVSWSCAESLAIGGSCRTANGWLFSRGALLVSSLTMAGQLEFNLHAAPRRIALSVTQLVRMVRETLELHLDEYWVVGEISNARLAASNHLYF